MGQCSCRCPELSHIKARCRKCEVHPAWSHLGNNRKSRCSRPCGGQGWWRNTKQVQETSIPARATQTHVNLHVTDWVITQQDDPILKTMIKWISYWKVQDLKHLLWDSTNTVKGKTIFWEWKNQMLYQGALYYCHTPTSKLEDVLWFVVPMAHQVAAMNGCHQDAARIPARIAQLVDQQTFMWGVLGSIPTPDSTWPGLTQPSIPLWVGKMSTQQT